MQKLFNIKHLPIAIIFIALLSMALVLFNGLKTIDTSVVKTVEHKGISFDNVFPDTTPELAKIKNFYETDRNRSYLKRLNISFRFFIPKMKNGMNIFQTSSEGSGVRMELQDPSILIMEVRSRDSNEITVPLSFGISAKNWYNVNLSIDERNRVKVLLNKEIVYNRIIHKMDYFIDDIAVGTGLSKTRNFEGILENFTIKYQFLEPRLGIQLMSLLQPISLILILMLFTLCLFYVKFLSKLRMDNFIFYLLFFLIIFFLNIYIYSLQKINFLYGDDIFAVNWVRNNYSLIGLMLKPDGSVYRPILELFLFIKYLLFGINYNLWFYSNVLHSFFNLLLIYYLSILILKNRFLAVLSTLIILLSQVRNGLLIWWASNGTLNLFIESWFLLMTIFLVESFMKKDIKKYFLALFFFLILIYTHEANLILVLFFLLFVFKEENIFNTRIKKLFGFITPLIISVSYYLIKIYVVNAQFWVAGSTGGNYQFKHISILQSVIPLYIQYFLQFININLNSTLEHGAVALYSKSPLFNQIVMLIFLIIIALHFAKYVFQQFREIYFKKEDKNNDRLGLYLIIILILIPIPAAFVPIYMQFRWVESAYIIFILLLILLVVRYNKRFLMISSIALFLLGGNYYYLYNNYLIANLNYLKTHVPKQSDLTENVFKQYGQSLKNYRIYVNNHNQPFYPELFLLDTISPYELFIETYKDYSQISINPISRKKYLILDYDEKTNKIVDLTENFNTYLGGKRLEYEGLLNNNQNNDLKINLTSATINLGKTLFLEGVFQNPFIKGCPSNMYLYINDLFYKNLILSTDNTLNTLSIFKDRTCHFNFYIPRDFDSKGFTITLFVIDKNYTKGILVVDENGKTQTQ